MFTGLKIAASGMNAERVRMNLVSSNLANSSTTHTPEGGPYKRQEAIFAATPADPAAMQSANPADQAVAGALRGVEVMGVQKDPRPGPLVYDPSNPDADANGNVRMPNVNMVEEMVDMITASRSFEANASSFQSLRDMALRALNIGG